VYILAFMGSQAIAASIWGAIGTGLGVGPALDIGAAVLVLAAASVSILPVHARTSDLDRTPVLDWPTPTLLFDPAPTDGPVLVVASYRVAPDNVPEFLAAMRELDLSRRRTGASRWRLYRDGADPSRYIEQFTVPSWGEHLRQHDERRTGADRDVLAEVLRHADADDRQVQHLFPTPGKM
jgi:Transmembrane secretion effector